MNTPVVSILIPAYNERFFGEAFDSALAQTLNDIEIVVCDDSPGDAIGQRAQAAGDARVRYVKNPARLDFAANFTQCLQLARGRYVKFLNDDDRLHPRCVQTFAEVLEANPNVALATSRRAVIDEAGRAAPDVPATTPVSHVSAFMTGLELGDFCLVNGLNLIGEPTTAMFRRADLVLEGASMFTWGGREYRCLADLSVWLRLLPRGFAYYGAGALSEYRRHAGQEQRQDNVRLGCLLEREWILAPAIAAGFLSHPTHRAAAVAAVRRMAELYAPLERSDPAARDAIARMRAGLAEIEAS